MVHQKHTQMPAKGNTEKNVVGQPFFPYFLAKGGAWFFFIFAALALLATFAQINPIWLYGPYSPVQISSASQPDFYMGILEGALRMMPAWEWNFLGHTLSLSVLIPFVAAAHLIFGGAAFWPFFEQWATGDKSFAQHQRPAAERSDADRYRHGRHGVLRRSLGRGRQRRPRRFPAGPALHDHLDFARVLIFVGPVLAFVITRRICLGLQRKDKETLLHGYETGIIRQLPNGEFIEVHKPVNEEGRAVLEAKKVPALMPPPGSGDANGVPAPTSRGVLGKARAAANRAFAETVVLEANGHGDGHGGNGHGPEIAGEEHEAVGAPGSPAQLPSGDEDA